MLVARAIVVVFLAFALASPVLAQTVEELRQELHRVQENMQRQQEKMRELERKLEDMEQQQKQSTETLGATVSTVEEAIPAVSGFAGVSFDLAGYAAANFTAPNDDDDANTFAVQWNPIFLFKIGDDLLFESEVEFHLEGDGSTEVELEYGQIDWFVHPRLALIAGKFLLPFNVFGERLHPAWINKFPSFPQIYQGEVVPTIGQTVLPVTSGVGAQLRGAIPLGNATKMTYALYVSNSPEAESIVPATAEDEAASGETEEEGEEEEEGVGSSQLRFGRGADLTDAKLFGGRVGFLPIPELEIGLSVMGNKAVNDTNLDFWGFGADAEFHLFHPLELRGEYMRVWRQISDTDDDRFTRQGYYLQAAYRLSWLPNRWLSNLEFALRGGQTFEEGSGVSHQIALGMLYWIKSSFVSKLAYEFNEGVSDEFDTNRLLVSLAYGF